MKGALLALALAACGAELDAPDVRRVWTCTSAFVCDGVTYQFSPSRYCAADEEGAVEKYLLAIDEAVKDVVCGVQYSEGIVCTTSPLAFCGT